MPVTPDTFVAYIHRRMHEIVESTEYSAQEKRFRAMAQVESLLFAVVRYLPQEQQVLVKEVLKLYEQLWPR